MKQLIITLSIAALALGTAIVPVEAINTDEVIVKTDDISKRELKKARDNYLKALNSDNKGLVESAIYHSLMLHIKYPEFNIDPIKAKLQELATTGTTHVIRYKAYLSISYLKNPDKFVGATVLARLLKYEKPDEFFGFLDKQLKKSLLTLKR